MIDWLTLPPDWLYIGSVLVGSALMFYGWISLTDDLFARSGASCATRNVDELIARAFGDDLGVAIAIYDEIYG